MVGFMVWNNLACVNKYYVKTAGVCMIVGINILPLVSENR